MSQPVSARLKLVVSDDETDCNNVNNAMDYALVAANGQDWYVDNVLFGERAYRLSLFFAPGNAVAIASRKTIDQGKIIGIKKALDYLAGNDVTLYFEDVTKEFSFNKPYSKNGNDIAVMTQKIYEYNFCEFYIWNLMQTKAIFGQFDCKNTNKLVMVQYHLTPSFPSSEKLEEYQASCRNLGLNPISSDPFKRRRIDYSAEDINYFMEYRFKLLNYERKVKPLPKYCNYMLDYQPTKKNCSSFKLLEKSQLYYYDSDPRIDFDTLTLAAFPPEIDRMGTIRSSSVINNAFFRANGTEWYKKYIMFGPRNQSKLYFSFKAKCAYMTCNNTDSAYIRGVLNALDFLFEKNDTLFAPVHEWHQPFLDKINKEKAIENWLIKNRDDFLFSNDWNIQVVKGSATFRSSDSKTVDILPFGFSNINIWPNLINGSMEGRIFRHAYEKECIEKRLNIIDDRCIKSQNAYSKADIEHYLTWIQKADDYYISLPTPSVYQIMDNNFINMHSSSIISMETYNL